jgi:phospholipase C
MSNSDAIEHVILVLLENRSFDHVLGWMSHPKYGGDTRIEGLTGDIDPGTGELVLENYRNPALLQTFRPFFVEVDEPLAGDLPHGRDEVTTQMAHSPVTGSFAMRGYAASYFHENPVQAGPFVTKPDCMRMLTPKAIPVTAFFARNFAVCDHWFTPIPTDTHPNRMMALSGYSEIEGTSTLEPDQFLVVDWAEENKVSWRVYSDDFSFMMCMKKGIAFRGIEVLKERALNGKYRGFSAFAHDFQHDNDFPKVTLIEPAYSDDPFAMEPNDNHPPLPMGPGESLLLKLYSALLGTDLARKRFDKTLVLVCSTVASADAFGADGHRNEVAVVRDDRTSRSGDRHLATRRSGSLQGQPRPHIAVALLGGAVHSRQGLQSRSGRAPRYPECGATGEPGRCHR